MRTFRDNEKEMLWERILIKGALHDVLRAQFRVKKNSKIPHDIWRKAAARVTTENAFEIFI